MPTTPRPRRSPWPALALALTLALLAAARAGAVSSYAVAAQDAPGSTTGAAAVALGVPDYAFVNDAGLPFGGSNAAVFGPGESTVLSFATALRDVPGQEDLLVSIFVGGAGSSDDANVEVAVSTNGSTFQVVRTFRTADARTTYPLRHERAFSSVKHFGVDFAGVDYVTHVRIRNLGGTAEGLRLDAVEGLHPVLFASRAFEIRFERYRGTPVERFLVRIKNMTPEGGAGIRSFRMTAPQAFLADLEETLTPMVALDGDLICVENCVGDNAPGTIPYSRHEWSVDGVNVAPAGVGLAPGRQVAHDRWENFDLDHAPATGPVFLAGFTFRITFTDGTMVDFDWDGDVVGHGVTGMLYQKYQYFSDAPALSGPEAVHYFEFAAPGPTCFNGLDDDGDGFADFPADLGCDGPFDTSERAAWLPCDDGVDNDGDLLVDYPQDPGCHGIWSAAENPQCSDGVDNDGDMAIDHPADAGCRAAWSTLEAPECSDGIDNDGDGQVDMADPQCLATWQKRENSRFCGLGFEIALLLPVLMELRRRARRT